MKPSMKQLKEKAHGLEPLVRIGKLGLTEAAVNEIRHHLKKKKLVKIRLLKSCLDNKDKEELKDVILRKTGALLVSNVGFVITLYYQKKEEDR
jgi:RNA-binding protein